MSRVLTLISILILLIPALVFAEVTTKTKWNADGTLTRNFYNSKGKEIGEQIIAKDGSLIKTTGEIPEGIVKEYLGNGKLWTEWNYKKGKLEGISKEYFLSGALLEKINYKDSKREGISKKYYESGKILAERNYKDGKLEGVSKMYFESGKLFAEMNYRNDKLDGDSIMRHENGELRSVETFKDGKTINIKAYDAEGKLLYDEKYPLKRKKGNTTTTQTGKENKPNKPEKTGKQ